MNPRLRLLTPTLALAAAACASAPPPGDAKASALGSHAASPGMAAPRETIVRASLEMIGAPYRYGGSSPRGFDCSGLVAYSYARAGISGLPHSAAALERLAAPIRLAELEPGDLLFFELTKQKKTSHVGIYVGDRAFVHAPSSGKRVERVTFDHVYWGDRLGRAGRILD